MRSFVDVKSICGSIFNELNRTEKLDLIGELLEEYGNAELCKNIYGESLLQEFSEEEVISHFGIEVK